MLVKITLLILLSLSIVSCDFKPNQEELLIKQELELEIEKLKEELSKKETTTPVIENPSLKKLSDAEVLERNAIFNEIQAVNQKAKKIKEDKLKEEKRIEAEKLKKLEAEKYIKPTPVIVTPTVPVPVDKPSTNKLKVNTKSGNLTLRQNPTTNSKALNALPKDTQVNYKNTKQEGDFLWYEVEYKGKTGWLRGDYIKPLN